MGPGYAVPGASFQVFEGGEHTSTGVGTSRSESESTIQTVVDALGFMVQHRSDYPRFDKSLKKEATNRRLF